MPIGLWGLECSYRAVDIYSRVLEFFSSKSRTCGKVSTITSVILQSRMPTCLQAIAKWPQVVTTACCSPFFFFSTINYGSKAAGLKCGVEGYWDQWMHYSNDCVISLWLRTVTDLAALAEDEGRCDRAHLPNSVEMGSGMMRKTVGHRCCQSHCSGYQLETSWAFKSPSHHRTAVISLPVHQSELV